MTKEEAVAKYTEMGLEVETGFDQSGHVYTPHAHETTYLFTSAGSIKIKKGESEWTEFTAGSECVIADGELHEAVVGDEGWDYVAGWDKEEAKKYDVEH